MKQALLGIVLEFNIFILTYCFVSVVHFLICILDILSLVLKSEAKRS